MFNILKRKPFKWAKNPEGKYLQQDYWNLEKIGYLPTFPIVIIDTNDGGQINSYKGFGEIEMKWNHMLFQNDINIEYPSYLIDSKMIISKIKYHREKFNYPKMEGQINMTQFLTILEKSELTNYIEFKKLSNVKEVFEKLMIRDYKYEYE